MLWGAGRRVARLQLAWLKPFLFCLTLQIQSMRRGSIARRSARLLLHPDQARRARAIAVLWRLSCLYYALSSRLLRLDSLKQLCLDIRITVAALYDVIHPSRREGADKMVKIHQVRRRVRTHGLI